MDKQGAGGPQCRFAQFRARDRIQSAFEHAYGPGACLKAWARIHLLSSIEKLSWKATRELSFRAKGEKSFTYK